MREKTVNRTTSEVKIKVKVNLDGSGSFSVKTGNMFINHIIETLSKHSLIDIHIEASGDLKHHLAEEVALTIGQAIDQALNDKKGIRRFGSAYVPMDDSLARATVDLGGRPYSIIDLKVENAEVEDLKREDIEHFFRSLAQSSRSNIHLTTLYGSNDHHKVEAATKALALALKDACSIEPRRLSTIPSIKGEL
ncbi:MAG: imidazoleglycerol-phosphate dehydratase HisB [Candidatus Bathyarchaeia archaeon]|nr:imidazoleglycerol-phosphate dehydratase HisB [Candidatus Bathyarchaeota archaeon]